MKKKIFVISGIIFILLVFSVVICFILFYNDKNEPERKDVDLNGIWFVYQYAEFKLDDEFMVFENGKLSDYRGGSRDPFITSNYVYKDSKLELLDISKEFVVKIVSERNIILVEPDTREYKLIKISDKIEEVKDMGINDIVGVHKVLTIAGNARENEVLEFTNSTFNKINNGQVEVSCEYALIDGHTILIEKMSKEYHIYLYNDYIMLVDKHEGYVWELKVQKN